MERHAMIECLERHGFKVTDKRKAIYDILHEHKRFMSAKELHELLIRKYPSMSLDTVYRNLTVFADLAVLELLEMDGERRYRLACKDQRCHHHHLICTGCGTTKIIPAACPLETLEIPSNFQITGHRFEIFGFCQQCSTTEASQA